jgi:hypothetical protein
MRTRNWLGAAAIAACSLWFGWLWFSPVFWQLAEGERTFSGGLESVFFRNDVRENFLGTSLDLQSTIWVFNKVDAILKGQEGSILPGIYFPFGFDLGMNEGFAWADALFALPLLWWIGSPGFYNLHVLVTLVLSYAGCMVLYRKAGAPLSIAIGLALVSVTSPFARQEILQGRVTQMHWILPCIYLFSLFKLLEPGPKPRWAAIGGLSAAGSCLVYWFGGVAVGFSGAIAFVAALLFRKKRLKRILLGILLAATTVAIPLAVTWRVSSRILQGEGSELYSHMQAEPQYTVDLPFLTIPVQKFLRVGSGEDLWRLATHSMMPLSLLGVGLLCFLLPWGWRRRWPWTLAMLVAIGIPVGPALIWDGGWLLTGHALLQAVFPPLLRCAFPHRMVVAPILLIGIFAAMALGDAAGRIRNPLFRTGAVLLATALLFGMGMKEFPVPWSTPTSHMGMDFTLLQATKEWPGGIVTIPIEKGAGNEHIQQMYHRQPILVGPGMDVVRPEGHKEYCEDNSLLRGLERMATEKMDSPPTYSQSDLRQLWDDGFRLVYIETRRTKSASSLFQDFLGTDGIYQQGGGQLAIPIPDPDKEPGDAQ